MNKPEECRRMSAENREPERGELLQNALDALRRLAQKGESPTRHQVRDLLLALGAEIRSGDTRAVEGAIESLHPILPAFGESWRTAVADEISLACTEHVRSVEPRYLDHPRYDFEYTIAARDRLELRLCAAEKLGLAATREWLVQVARADALLTSSLERRSKREGRNP